MNNFFQALEDKITKAYTEGVSLDEAAQLAGEFLTAQMKVAAELRTADMDSRMRKSGLKAVKATVYMDTCAKADKKPTESALEHILATEPLVQEQQNSFDDAEVHKAYLERMYDICREAHIHFRGIAKGRIE